MMDENVGSKLDSTGAEALSNKDKAGKSSGNNRVLQPNVVFFFQDMLKTSW